jgi:membrane protein required for colicin V production
MGIYDTIMLIFVAALAFTGWRKGMVSQLASIVSLIASFFVAASFYERVAVSISAPAPWNSVAAFVVTYLGTSLVVWLFFKQIRSSVKRMQLGDFDRQLGGLLGIAKGVALATIITLVAVNLLTEGPRQAIAQSRSGVVVSKIVHVVGPMMPGRVQEFLASYVQRLDEVLGNPTNPYQDPYGQGGYQVESGSPSGYPPAPGTGYADPYSPSRGYGQYPPQPGTGQPQYAPPSQPYPYRSSTQEQSRYE